MDFFWWKHLWTIEGKINPYFVGSWTIEGQNFPSIVQRHIWKLQNRFPWRFTTS